MKTMILAAGYGTRFRPHSETSPKPIFPFLNIPLIDYSIFIAELFQSEELIVNTHHLPQKIEKTVKDSGFNNPIRFSREKEILGNGGGVGHVRRILADGHFLLLNSDTVVIPDRSRAFANFQQVHHQAMALATLMVMPHPEVGTRYNGVWLDDGGNVYGFGKVSPAPEKNLKPYHFYGVRLFSPEVFRYIPQGNCDIFYDSLTTAISDGATVKAVIEPAVFFDGGYLEGFLNDSKLALSLFEKSAFLRKIAERFWPDFSKREDWRCGVGYSGPTADYQQPHRLFGRNVIIEDDVRIEGLCILGDDVTVRAGSRLKNIVVNAGATVTGVVHEELIL